MGGNPITQGEDKNIDVFARVGHIHVNDLKEVSYFKVFYIIS